MLHHTIPPETWQVMLGVRIFAFHRLIQPPPLWQALGGGGKKRGKKGEKTPVKKLLCFTGQQSQVDKMNRRFGVQSVLAIIMKTFFRSK